MGKIDYSQAVSFSYSAGSSTAVEEEDEDLVKERKRREESLRKAKIIEERKRAARGGRGRGRGRGRGGGQRKAPPPAAAKQRRQDTGPEPLESIDEVSESRMDSAATSVKAPSARGRGRGRGRPAYNPGPTKVQSRPVTSQSQRPVTSQSQRPDTSKSKRPETSQSKRPITAQSNHSEPIEKPPPEEPKVKEEEPKKEEPKKEEQKEEQQEQPVPEPQPAKKKKFSAAVRASIFMRSLFGKKKQEEPEPEPEPEVKEEEEKEEEEKPEEKKESEEEAAKQEEGEEKKDEEKEETPPPPPPPKSPTPEPKEPEANTELKKEEEEKTPTPAPEPVPEPEPKPESPAQASNAEEEGTERKSLVSIKEEPKEEVKQEEKVKTPEPPQDEEMTEEDKEKARGILSSIFGKRKTLAPAVRASRTSLQSIGTVDSESQEDKPKKGFLKGLFGRKKSEDDNESMRASRISLNRSMVSLQHSSETGNSPRNDPVVNIKPPTPPPVPEKEPSPPTPPPPPPEQKPETSTSSNRPVVIINTSANDGSFQRTLIEALRGNVSTEESEQTQPKQTQQPDQPQMPQQPQLPQQLQGVPPNTAYTGLSPQMVPYPVFQPQQPFYGQPNPYMYPPPMMPGYGGYPGGGYPGAFPPFNMAMPPVNNPMLQQQQNMVFQQPQPVQQAMPIQQQQPVVQQANQISYSNTQPMTGASSYTTRGQVAKQPTNNNQPLHIVEKLDAALLAERQRPVVPEDEFEDSDSDDSFYSSEQRKIRRKKRRAKEEKRTGRERRRRDEEEREREREEERKSKPRTPPPPDIDLSGLLSLIETGQEPPEPGKEEPVEDDQQSRPESSKSTGNEKVPLTEEDELSRLLAQLGAAPSSGTPVPKSAKKRRKSAPKMEMENRENTLLTMLREEDKRLDQLKNNSNRRKSTTDFRTKSRGDNDKRSSVPNLGLFPMGQPGEHLVQSPGQFSGINPEQTRKMSAERLLHEAQKKLMSVQQSLQT